MAAEWRLLVERVKRLAVPSGREALGEFALEGHRSMERALRNDAPLKEALVSRSFAESEQQREKEILEALRQKGVPLRIAPEEVFRGLTGSRRIGDVFGLLPLPEPPDWERLFAGEGRRLLVVGWNFADPGNTGAVIRSALAAGACGFLAVGSTDPWHPKSVRTSMGSLFKLPIRRVAAEEDWLQALAARQVETFATVCERAEALPGLRPRGGSMALILGSEAFGLPESVAAACDRRVTIPMPAGVDSFSVNAAAAILTYSLMHAADDRSGTASPSKS